MNLKDCKSCGKEMDKDDIRCPHCDYLDTASINTFILAFSAATIIIFIVFGIWIWKH